MISIGGGSSSGSSTTVAPYSRSGNTANSQQYTYGPALSGLINDNLSATSTSGSPQKSFVSGLVGYDNTVPGYAANLAGTQLNPYTSSYETSTDSLYQNRLQNALALSRSGQQNVMAPLQRGDAYKQSETLNEYSRGRDREIRDERNVDSQINFKAIETMLGQRLQAAGLFAPMKYADQSAFMTAAQLLGQNQTNLNENTVGVGTQVTNANSSGMGASAGCCFIFLEAYYGMLPASIRKGRDAEMGNGTRRKGYIEMSKWCVPLMRVSKFFRKVINKILIQPFTREGERVYGSRKTKTWMADFVICHLWYKLWEVYGA